MPYKDKAQAAAWHQANKEQRNAIARARYHANPAAKNAARASARKRLSPEKRDEIRAKDRAYRASRKDKDRAYIEANRERIAALRRDYYLRKKARAKKRDPIAAAKRLAARAQVLAHTGYAGTLKPNHF